VPLLAPRTRDNFETALSRCMMKVFTSVLCVAPLFLSSASALPSGPDAPNDRDQKRDSISFSPPYYPTPKGGWVAEWRTSYAKAQALVAQMTLSEKVNLTTGTGLFMVSLALP
jgi:hypothetical protein